MPCPSVDLYIGPLISAGGILLGAGVVLWRLHYENKANRDLQRESFKKRMVLDLYEKIAKEISGARQALKSVRSENGLLEGGGKYSDPRVFLRENADAIVLSMSLVDILEKYSIALPDLYIFRLVFVVQARRIQRAWEMLTVWIRDTLQVDPEKTAVTWKIPEERQDEFRSYNAELNAMGDYLADLQTAAQNSLLSDIFVGREVRSYSLDPSRRIISADPKERDELLEFLRNRAVDKEELEKILVVWAGQKA